MKSGKNPKEVSSQKICDRLSDATDRLMCLLINNLDSEGMEDLAEIFFCTSILARARRISYLEALSLKLFEDINDWNLHVVKGDEDPFKEWQEVANNDTDTSR